MMEDESVKSCIGKISKIVVGIKSCNRTKDEDKIIWNILKNLTPPFKKITQMIEKVIPCSKKFFRETLPGILKATKVSLKQSRDLTRVETTFSTLSVHPSLSSTSGDYTSSIRSIFKEDRNIEEGIALLVKRELDGKKIFEC